MRRRKREEEKDKENKKKEETNQRRNRWRYNGNTMEILMSVKFINLKNLK